ncbi:hypothetical protein [Actinospongicola halichondriae]|uniref:hypothetical protein n=1 Tax=Actinospongicola halichondriae TaxID=3236844 RepID=UPI003D412CDF
MLSSIHPLGERAKDNRFAVTATLFVVGCVLGGITTGAVAALVGLAVGALVSSNAAVVLVSVLVAAAAVVEGRGISLPCLHRQVDEAWLDRYRGWVYGVGFGFQLGAGVLTYITSAGVYAAIGAAVLVGHPLGAVAIMGLFGLVRGLSLVPARSITSPEQLRSFFRRLHATAPTAQRVSCLTLAVVAIAAPVTLL